jgi:hypothetical protein
MNMPNPPAGTTSCGMGSLTAAEVQAACAKTPSMGMLPAPQKCSAVTTSGASWQAWCDATGLRYVWVTVHDAQAVSTVPTSVCSVQQNNFDYTEDQFGYPVMITPKPYWYVGNAPADFSTGYDLSGSAHSGMKNFWMAGLLECQDLTQPNSTMVSTDTLLGFNVTWN